MNATTDSQSLQEIHDELKELRLLYERLINKLLPVGEATLEEKEAIASTDEVADEEELFRTLGVHNTDKA